MLSYANILIITPLFPFLPIYLSPFLDINRTYLRRNAPGLHTAAFIRIGYGYNWERTIDPARTPVPSAVSYLSSLPAVVASAPVTVAVAVITAILIGASLSITPASALWLYHLVYPE